MTLGGWNWSLPVNCMKFPWLDGEEPTAKGILI